MMWEMDSAERDCKHRWFEANELGGIVGLMCHECGKCQEIRREYMPAWRYVREKEGESFE